MHPQFRLRGVGCCAVLVEHLKLMQFVVNNKHVRCIVLYALKSTTVTVKPSVVGGYYQFVVQGVWNCYHLIAVIQGTIKKHEFYRRWFQPVGIINWPSKYCQFIPSTVSLITRDLLGHKLKFVTYQLKGNRVTDWVKNGTDLIKFLHLLHAEECLLHSVHSTVTLNGLLIPKIPPFCPAALWWCNSARISYLNSTNRAAGSTVCELNQIDFYRNGHGGICWADTVTRCHAKMWRLEAQIRNKYEKAITKPRWTRSRNFAAHPPPELVNPTHPHCCLWSPNLWPLVDRSMELQIGCTTSFIH